MTAIAIFIMGTLLILLLDYHLSYLNSILYHIWKELNLWRKANESRLLR